MTLIRKILATVTALTTGMMMASPVIGVTAEELLAQIQQLQQQLAQLMQQYQQLTGQGAGAPAACSGITFDRDLKVGMTGNDVKCLQALLNQDPATKVADSGAGSPGNETTYFGERTKAAVIKFQEKYASEILAPVGLSSGTGYVGAKTRAKLNSILAAGVPGGPGGPGGPSVPSAGLTVSLASDNPASTVILGNQVNAPLMKLALTNGDSSAGKITKITVKRTGISDDSVLRSIVLLDEEGNLLGDEQIFSNGVATFEDSAGLLTIGAGQTTKITVAGNVESGKAGYTVGVSVTNIVGTFTAVNATFPINGNVMSIGNDITTSVTVDSDSDANSSSTYNPGETEITVWSGTITPNAKVALYSVALKAVGNIEPKDVQNFKFYLAGSEIGSVAQMGSDYIVKLNLAANPVTVTAGSKELKVVADIIGGTNRSVGFVLYIPSMYAVDLQYGVGVPIVSGGNLDWEVISIGAGSITLQAASDTPVSVGTTTDALIAKYVLKAYGERVKITGFVATSTNAPLFTVKIYIDGAEKGSVNYVTTTGTSIDTVDFYIEAGNSVTVEVKADTTNYGASTIELSLTAGGGTKSGTPVSAGPAAVVLDVIPASFTYNYANQPSDYLAVAGTEAYVAKYKFEAKGNDATIKELRFTTGASAPVSGLKFNIGGNSYTAELSSGAWRIRNINYTVSVGQAVYGDVYVNLTQVNSATDGQNAQVTMAYIRYAQAGREITNSSVNKTGSNVYVYKAVPKVTALTTGTGTGLAGGNQPSTLVLYRWKVEAVGGTINSTSVTTTLNIQKAGPEATTTVATSSVKVYVGGVDVTSKVTLTFAGINNAASTTGTIIITPKEGYPSIFEVGGGSSITLEVKAEVTAANKGWIKTWLAGDAASATYNFGWYDGIGTAGGYLVEGLPSDGTEPYTYYAPTS